MDIGVFYPFKSGKKKKNGRTLIKVNPHFLKVL
jgi:hypothetical protein